MSATGVLDGAVRVSNLGGRIVSADSTMTLDDQRQRLTEAAAAVGKRVGKVYDLLDQSGFTSAGGEVMGEMLQRCEDGLSDGVVFAYTDRNGRNWWEQGPFFSKLERAGGMYVIRGMESIDYRSSIGRQVFGMKAVQDESVYWTAKEKAESTVGGMMTRRVYNRVPYGFQRNGTWIDGRLVDKREPDRDEKALVKDSTAAVIERIFTMRDQDFSVGAIVRALNEDGIPGPRGGNWTKTTVASILRNPIYKGTIVYGRKHPKRRPGAQANVREVHEPAMAIVSAALWKRVQEKGHPPVRRTGAYKAGVAGGVVVCAACGRAMRVLGTGDGRLMYSCPREDATAPPCPRPTSVKKDAADAYVDDAVSGVLAAQTVGKPVADVRRVAATREAVAAAQANLDALDNIAPTHPKFAEWANRYEAELLLAQEAQEAAEAEADALSGLPASAADYLALPLIDRNRAARALLRVEVAAPLSRSRFADITERFTPVWR